jgi:hypothetical protein
VPYILSIWSSIFLERRIDYMSKITVVIFLLAGFLVFNLNDAYAQESWTTYTTSEGLPNNNCYSVLIDNSGNSWIGLRGGVGTYFISKYDGVTWTNYGFGDGATGSGKVWVLYLDSHNTLWAGTDGIGVLRTTDGGATWDTTTFRMSNGLGSDSIRAIAEDLSGNIWFACGPHPDQGGPSGGLTKWDGTSITTYKSDTSRAVYVGGGNSELPDNFVQALIIDDLGNLWGGTKGNGAFRWDMSGAYTGWTHFTISNSNLMDNVINPGALDNANGFLWFGLSAAPSSAKNGAQKFDGSTWTQVMSGARIWTIVHDWEDSIWMGDADPPGNATGLYKFAPDGSVQSKNWTTGDGMIDNVVRRIAIDNKNGKVWCVGQNGVSVLSGNLKIGAKLMCNISEGWNLISVPVLVEDNEKSTLYPTASSSAFTYDGSYFTDDSLDVGTGYWLKFNSSERLAIKGLPTDIETVSVKNGWNMIGSISEPVPIATITSDPPSMITSDFYEYNGAYISSDTIMPCRGYWVKVGEAGKLILSSVVKGTQGNFINIVHNDELPPLPPDTDNKSYVQAEQREYTLEQNFPNPFNPGTTINYSLKEVSDVTIEIYNILGMKVVTLYSGIKEAGRYTIRWNGETDNSQMLGSGICFIRIFATGKLSGTNVSIVRKAVISK